MFNEQPCPELVFPNWNDHDYVLASFDETSLATLRTSVSLLGDPLARAMAIRHLFDRVVHAQASAADYVAIALNAIQKERHAVVLKEWIDTLHSLRHEDFTAFRVLAGEARARLVDELEARAWQWLTTFAPGSDLQLVALDLFLATAHSEESLARLSRALQAKALVRGIGMDQMRRWKVIQALCRNGHASCPKLGEAELVRDSSGTGRKEAISASAIYPDPASKAAWYSAFLTGAHPAFTSLTEFELRTAMTAFSPAGDERWALERAPTFGADLAAVAKARDPEYSERFASALYPDTCGETTVALPSGLPKPVAKAVRIGQQQSERCAKARSK